MAEIGVSRAAGRVRDYFAAGTVSADEAPAFFAAFFFDWLAVAFAGFASFAGVAGAASAGFGSAALSARTSAPG